MADQDESETHMGEVVSQVTVKALQEFDTGEMDRAGSASKSGSRPGSVRPGSGRPGSGRPASGKGSRPTSAASKPPSRPGSGASDKPGSRRSSRDKPGSRAGSQQGSPAGSQQGSRPGSAAEKGSRPSSVQADDLVVAGSRPTSARRSPEDGDRPQSGRPGTVQSGSGRPGSGRPESGSGRSGSGRPESGSVRPESGSGMPGSGRPESGSGRKSGSDRPASVRSGSVRQDPTSPQGSATGKPGSRSGSGMAERPGSERASSGRLGSGRPSSGQPSSQRPAAEEAEGDGGDQPARQPPASHDPDQSAATLPQSHDEVIAPPGTRASNFPSLPPGGGGDDDDDGGDESDADEDELGDEEEEDSEESEGDGEMVVLDPDHPLMKRFQKALKQHLVKVNEKVTLELNELLEAVKGRHKEREDLGVELYGVQQELARHQMMLERGHDDYANLNRGRRQKEQQLDDTRHQYKDGQLAVNEDRKKGAELQGEVENIALRLFYMDNAKEDVRSDIAVMKRAAEKAESEVLKAETDKQNQDMYVDRLVEGVDKLREEIAMYDAQLTAQHEETKAAKEALNEAYMEIESISLEKKQLFQQWNSSLIGMRRRDEAFTAMMEALNQQQQRIMSMETEIEGYKKSISKEQEQNEKLTTILNKTEQDITTVKKLMVQCQAKHEALKNEYATYTRMLHETEQALNRANTDKTLRLNEVNALRKQIEREYLEKVKLEDEILEKLRSQLTLDKAAQYTDKLTKKMRHRTKELDTQVAQVENDISKDTLEVSNTKMRVERLQKVTEELDEEILQKNDIVSKSLAEMTKRNAIIERKQGVIDQYNKKLEQMIQQAGGVELGPLEIQINSLQKSIEAEQQEISELKQMWLRDQSELVRLAKDKDDQSQDVDNLKKQLTILSQKKLRIEGEINTQNCETNDIERNTRNMQNDMLKLNLLLHKERGMEMNLQQNNILMENDFVGSLKGAERESIEMQERLDGMKEEKERLLNSLVEAERQIMLWEKKTQLARETRQAVDSEVGQGEVSAMKAEIHRMQVRYAQLMKQQERMIQEMEKAVSRRDTIVTRGDAQSKINKKVLTKGTFQRQMAELKKKIKQTIQDASTCDGEIRELHEHQQEMSSQLEERQLNVQQLQGNADTLDGDIERLLEHKQKNMTDLLAHQQKSKYFQQAKDGKYTRLCRTDTSLDNERQKQVDRMQTISAIIDRLTQEHPHVQPVLRRAMLAFGSRGLSSDGEY